MAALTKEHFHSLVFVFFEERKKGSGGKECEEIDRQADRQTGRQTDGQTDRDRE